MYLRTGKPPDRRGGDPPRRRSVKSLVNQVELCLLYTSDAADERSSVDLGGRRIIKKKKARECRVRSGTDHKQQLTQTR